MKKYLLMPLIALVMVLSFYPQTKKANAQSSTTTESAPEIIHENLINPKKLEFDSQGKISYHQPDLILKANTYYTFVFGEAFFGTLYPYEVMQGEVCCTFTPEGEGALKQTIKFELITGFNEFMYFYYKPKESGLLEFEDLVSRGLDPDSPFKEAFIFYEGTIAHFQGFRKYVDKTGYETLGDSLDIYTSLDDPLKLEDITNNLKAYDPQTGFLDNQITIEKDDYSTNMGVAGVHEVLYKTVDTNKIEKMLSVKIHIIDNSVPVINGPDKISFDNSSLKAPSLAEIQEKYTVSDNSGVIDSSRIYFIQNGLENYVPNRFRLYQVTLGVKDGAGNEGRKTIQVEMKDVTAPVLNIKEEITYKLSELPQTFEVLINEVIISYSDNSGDVSCSYNIYAANDETVGYPGDIIARVTVKDPSKNKTEKQCIIHIIDDVAPEFLIKSFLIETSVDKPLNGSDIVKQIENNLRRRSILFDNVTIISSKYNENSGIGSYDIKYLYEYEGHINTEAATINVVENKESANSKLAIYALIAIPCVVGVVIYIVGRKRRKMFD